MFDLEQAITGWRRQMLAAGIEAPVPLEELEIHLREEIERHAGSGLNEAEAFQAAVQKIGPAPVLQKEFKKVKKDYKIMRTLLLSLGWLAAGFTLLFSIAKWNVDWCFSSFDPEWNLSVSVEFLGVFVADTAIWFLAKASHDKASQAVSLLVCSFLVGMGIFAFFRMARVYGIFGGGVTEIPIWYRSSLALLLSLPGIFWVWWTRRHTVAKRHSTQGRQYV